MKRGMERSRDTEGRQKLDDAMELMKNKYQIQQQVVSRCS